MLVAVRRRKGNDVHVPVLEPFRRDDEFADRRDGVTRYFGALAFLALSGPSGYVLAD